MFSHFFSKFIDLLWTGQSLLTFLQSVQWFCLRISVPVALDLGYWHFCFTELFTDFGALSPTASLSTIPWNFIPLVSSQQQVSQIIFCCVLMCVNWHICYYCSLPWGMIEFMLLTHIVTLFVIFVCVFIHSICPSLCGVRFIRLSQAFCYQTYQVLFFISQTFTLNISVSYVCKITFYLTHSLSHKFFLKLYPLAVGHWTIQLHMPVWLSKWNLLSFYLMVVTTYEFYLSLHFVILLRIYKYLHHLVGSVIIYILH